MSRHPGVLPDEVTELGQLRRQVIHLRLRQRKIFKCFCGRGG
jgi:hypothetical protein